MILDEKYKLDPGISNSMQKEFVNKGPKIFFDKYLDPMRVESVEFSTESTDIGDLADCLATTPELFDKYYYITGDVKLSAAQKDIILAARGKALHAAINRGLSPQDALKHPTVTKASEAGPYFLEAAREYRDPTKSEEEAKKGYQGAWKDETMQNHFIEKGASYYSDLTVAAGRKIIDQSLYNIASRKCDEMKNDERIGPWLTEKPSASIEIHYQYMVTAVVNNVPCKILLDYCRIDHENKIISPKDIKTALSREQFRINYEKYGYANQGSFYTGVLKHKYPGYHIEPFEFIVACTDSNEDPMIYRMSQNELDATRDGGTLKTGKRIKGWMAVLEEIRWHMETSQWRYPKEYYDKGYVIIDSYSDNGVDTEEASDPDIF